jgi:hypothetical protein
MMRLILAMVAVIAPIIIAPITPTECQTMADTLRVTRDYVPAMHTCLGDEDSPLVDSILS